MKRLALIAAICASSAIADNIQVFVVDESGQGVVQRESKVTKEEAEILIGGKPPAGTTGVVLQRGEPAAWTDLLPQEVNARFGGQGEPYIEHRDGEDNDPETGADADEEEPRRNPEEDEESDIEFELDEDKFPTPDAMNAARIQPQDGMWAIEIREQIFTGCPAGIEDAARAQVAALQTSSNTGIFGPDFTPQDMAPQFDWTQTGGNSWHGILDQTGERAGVYMQWAVQVESPTVINHRQQLNFMGAGLGNCEVYSFVTSFWVN